MFSRTLTTAALTFAAAGLFAGSAHAAVIDTDSVRQTSTGYDLGGSTFVAGAPTGSGEIHFHLEGGQVRPHVLGTLHLDDADGTCSRVRLQYRDDAGALLTTKLGGQVCVSDDAHHAFSVDLDPYSDNRIDRVDVAVMKVTATGELVATSTGYTANTFPDNGHHEFTVDLDPYESNKVGKVTVQLQTLAASGAFVTAGSSTVSIAE